MRSLGLFQDEGYVTEANRRHGDPYISTGQTKKNRNLQYRRNKLEKSLPTLSFFSPTPSFFVLEERGIRKMEAQNGGTSKEGKKKLINK